MACHFRRHLISAKFLKMILQTTFFLLLAVNTAYTQYTFPLRISDNKRYLQDVHGKPFPILGRTAWCIISQPVSEQHTFIEHTKSFGYNAIEMSAICHWRSGNHAPCNGRGDLPFLKKLDGTDWKDSLHYTAGKQSPNFTAPKEAYWKYMDAFVDYCESKGILIFFFPAYVGYHDGDQGWMEELAANGPEKVKAYGRWIANRYKNSKNLVWMLLGDDGKFSPEKRDAEAALIAGLKSVPDRQSIYCSAESFSGQNSAENEYFGKEMTLNGVYNWEKDIAAQGRRAYAHEPTMPAYLLEEPYDEEGPDGNNYNPHAVQPVRRFQWWGWLTTIGGYVAGNGYIWPFIDPLWQQHLSSPGARDMKVLNEFIQSIDWWRPVPDGLDGMRNLVVGNSADTASDYVAAACSKEGDLLVAYVPPGHGGTVMVDLSAMNGKLSAEWFDVTSGEYWKIEGKVSGKMEFKTRGKNGKGEGDWVLVVKEKNLKVKSKE